MCLPLPWGKLVLYCCDNGSYVESGDRRKWSERAPMCPPLPEGDPEEGDWLVAAVWALVSLCLLFCCVRLAVSAVLFKDTDV